MGYRIVSDSSSNLLEFKGNEHYTTVPLQPLHHTNELIVLFGVNDDMLQHAL